MMGRTLLAGGPLGKARCGVVRPANTGKMT